MYSIEHIFTGGSETKGMGKVALFFDSYTEAVGATDDYYTEVYKWTSQELTNYILDLIA